MVCHRWWKAAIDAARVVLYGPIEAEVDPAYGLPGYSARCNIAHMLQKYFYSHCDKNYFRMARRRAWQKGCGLLLEKDLEMRRSKVTVNIQLISRFIFSGEFLGKKQDELVAILEGEEDFQSSRTLLEERMAEMGARLVLLPKFHPEFNPVECNYRYINHSQ